MTVTDAMVEAALQSLFSTGGTFNTRHDVRAALEAALAVAPDNRIPTFGGSKAVSDACYAGNHKWKPDEPGVWHCTECQATTTFTEYMAAHRPKDSPHSGAMRAIAREEVDKLVMAHEDAVLGGPSLTDRLAELRRERDSR